MFFCKRMEMCMVNMRIANTPSSYYWYRTGVTDWWLSISVGIYSGCILSFTEAKFTVSLDIIIYYVIFNFQIRWLSWSRHKGEECQGDKTIKSIVASSYSCSEHSLVFFSGLLVATATAQLLGDLFPERNRTQCPSPEVLRAAGCNINCIQRNMTSDEGCAYCNRTCNGLFVHNSTPNLLMVFYCPENCIENVCRVQQQLTSCFWFTHIVAAWTWVTRDSESGL